MNQVQKKINYCRLSLHGGILNRMEMSGEDKLVGAGGGYFSYLTPVFDTYDVSSSFHRLTLQGSFVECKCEVIVAATDVDIRDRMFQEGITPVEQGQLLRELTHVRCVNKTDILLHELEGRYLWVYIGVSASSLESRFVIDGFRVEFPKSSFLEYFPEVYQTTGDTFFYRYMAALQSLYVDLEDEIDRLPMYLDYESTGEKELEMLADWAGISKEEYPYDPAQLRYLIANLWELQAGKGTKAVLQKMLQMVTKRPVYVVEYFKWHGWMEEETGLTEVFKRLYGGDEEVFSVVIDFTDVKASQIPEGKSMMRLIESYMPLGLRCNLVYLTESSHMDTHCYLDVNSCLSTPVTADASGFVLGGNYILG